ncbi:MAG: FtsW/RodA/SpoVE family cell cycle protein [Bacteroidales bacterium]
MSWQDRSNEIKKALTNPNMGDKYIWGIFIALAVVSLVESYSASSREITASGIYLPIIKHGGMLLMGGLMVFIIQLFSYEKYLKLIFAFIIASIILVIYVSIFGDMINGARRSITVLGFSLQSAEFAKISIVMLISWVLARNQKDGTATNLGVKICAVSVIIFCGLLFKQGLTNALLLMAVSLSMMIIGGVQWSKLGLVLVAYLGIGLLGLGIMEVKDMVTSEPETEIIVSSGGTTFTQDGVQNRKGTWVARLERYFDKTPLYEQPINSINQQEMFSYMAQANGGIIGVFPGNSRECSRLPLAFSDYIYSIIVEEWGFIGGFILLILYLWLLARAGVIATKCNKAFPALLVMGMAVMIVFQALFHMAINVGVFPVSGQPLPLISKGGTSILVTSIAFGFMLSVSKYAQITGKISKKAESGLPNELISNNPMQF